MKPQPITFFVPGHPKTAGSKRAVPYQRRDGSFGTRIIDDCAAGANWRHMVAITAKPFFPRPLSGPLSLSLTFFLERPKSHSGPSGLKSAAPELPTTRPDLTKMIRAAEDALTGIAWKDDAQIICQMGMKIFSHLGRPGVEVEIKLIETTKSTSEETINGR